VQPAPKRVTKSGTNGFQGNAGWQWNGAKLNANDWFNNASDPFTPRPHAVSNEWEWSIGGPIKKNKAFFFFDNEGLRYHQHGGRRQCISTRPQGAAVAVA
jgi:hypothetical protein